MTLQQAKEQYANEWIAFRILKEGDDPEGEVLLHHHDRHVFDRALLQHGLKNVYITYAGPPVPEGYSILCSGL